MGMRDMQFVAKKIALIRCEARRIARRNKHTDTNELVSTLCRRMGQLPEGDRFNNTEDGVAYSRRVMENGSIDHARSAKAELERRVQHEMLMRVAKVEFPDIPTEDVVEAIDQMSLLGTGHRLVLDMYCRGITSKQIADLTDGNAATVRSRILAAKVAIRAQIQAGQR